MSATKPKECIGCPLYDSREYVPSSCTCPPCQEHTVGPHTCKATMLLVGIAPSYQEVASGQPLVGPSGRKIDAAIQWALSVLRKSATALFIRKTNLVLCRTTQPGKRGRVNRDPTKEEIAHCTSRHLVHEVERPTLRVIVPLGELVHNVLCSARFKECVGSRIKYSTSRIKDRLEGLWAKVKGLN